MGFRTSFSRSAFRGRFRNLLHTVALVSDSTNVTSAGNITLTASATGTGVAEVRFYKNGVQFDVDVSSPFTTVVALTSSDNATINYTAKSYDSNGNLLASSNTVSVTVNISANPATSVDLASSSTNVTAAGNITLTATVGASITKVEFYRNGGLLATDTNSPFTATDTLSTAQNGTLTYNAKGYDSSGNVTTSADVSVVCNIASAAPSGPTVVAQDNFNGTAGTLITAHTSDTGETWAKLTGTAVASVLQTYGGATLVAPDEGYGIFATSRVSSIADCEVTGVIRRYDSTATSAGVAARCATIQPSGALRCYLAVYNGTSGTGDTWDLIRFWDGSYTTLASVAASAIAVGSDATLKLSVTGTGASVALVVNVNGTDVITYNDTDALRQVAPGQFGYYLYAAYPNQGHGLMMNSIQLTESGANAGGPTVTLSSSLSDVITNAPFTLTATASDADGVGGVEFYRDGVLFAVKNSSPHTVTDSIAIGMGTKNYTAIAYDVLGNTNTSNTVSVTYNIAVAAPASDQTPLAAVANGGTFTTLSFENATGSAMTNTPFTIGHVFKKGTFSANSPGLQARLPDNSVVTLQVDPKATHSDGSIRHAIISGVLPTIAANTALKASLERITTTAPTAVTPSAFLTTGFTGVVKITDAGTDYSASIESLLAGTYTTWINGPICNEWMVKAPLKSAGNVTHPHLHARVTVRTYPGQSKTRVDVTLENTWAYDAAPQPVDITFSVTLNGTSVLSQAYTHMPRARYRKTFWLGTTEPALHIRHNTRYLMDSRAVPNYDTSIVPDQATIDNYNSIVTSAAPMTRGIYDPDMTNTGPHIHIGALPSWQVHYLLQPDAKTKTTMLRQDEIAGCGITHYRDEVTDYPMAVVDHPYVSTHATDGAASELLVESSVAFTRPFNCDGAHQPSVGYLPYLLTGDYFYLDEMHFWTQWQMITANSVYRRHEKSWFQCWETRGQAWIMRSHAQAVYITPDDHPLKAKLTDVLDYNLIQYNSEYSYGTDPAMSWGGLINTQYATQYNNGIAYSGFQDDFFTLATGICWDLDITRAIPLLNYKSKYAVARLTSSCYIMASAYYWNVRDSVNSAIYTTWDQVYAASTTAEFRSLACGSQAMADYLNLHDSDGSSQGLHSFVPGEMVAYSYGATGGPSQLGMATAYAASIKATGGENAWQVFDNRQVKPSDFNVQPQFAVIPRGLTPAVPGAVDTYSGISLGSSIAGVSWDSGGLSWSTKTYLVGDGANSVKGNKSQAIVGNFTARAADVGFAVFYTPQTGIDGTMDWMNIRVGGDSTLAIGNYDSGVTGVRVAVGGYGSMYLVDEFGSVNDGGKSVGAPTVGQQYCVEVCRTDVDTVYRVRLSLASGNVRGSLIAESSITLAAAVGIKNTACQIQIPISNQDYITIQKVETITTPFGVGGGATDTIPPSFVSASVSNTTPSTVSITFNETLASVTPAASSFTVSGSHSVTAVAVSGTGVNLTVSPAVASGESITVSYTQPGTSKLQDASANAVASFGPSAITNNVGVTGPMFAYSTAGTAITGPNVTVEFGASGSAAALEYVEQVYTGMSIGFTGDTQDRWRCRPVTVTGTDGSSQIQFVAYVGVDSTGRVDVWLTAQADTSRNHFQALVDLRIKIGSTYQTLWDGTTTYTYKHQRGTWLRWQSSTLPWKWLDQTYINSMISDGTFMKHDHTKYLGGSLTSTVVPTVSANSYKPFKAFTSDGTLSIDSFIGSQYRGTAAPGERSTVGHVYEPIARIISTVGVNGDTSYLTTAIQNAILAECESIAQFPLVSGMLDARTGRLIDPSYDPITTQRDINPDSGLIQGWFTPVPQPNGSYATMNAGVDTNYASADNAHAANKTSYHAYWFTKDPWFLFLTQSAAIFALSAAQGTGLGRGSDGKALQLSFSDEERGHAWAWQSLLQAWKATPSGALGKPFVNKTFFETALSNSTTSFANAFTGGSVYDWGDNTNYSSGVKFEAIKYWRNFTLGTSPSGMSFRTISPFMCDYMNTVFAQGLLLGYGNTNANFKSLAQWRFVNAIRRAKMGGNWHLYDTSIAEDVPSGGSSVRGGIWFPTMDTNNGSLPYSTLAEFKTWYANNVDTANGYVVRFVDGILATTDWNHGSSAHGHTLIFYGMLNALKECANRSLVSVVDENNAAMTATDIATLETTFLNQHPTTNSGYDAWSKNVFGY